MERLQNEAFSIKKNESGKGFKRNNWIIPERVPFFLTVVIGSLSQFSGH